MFLSKSDEALTEEFLEKGYVIRPVVSRKSLDWIQSKFLETSLRCLGEDRVDNTQMWLNKIHERVQPSELNRFRLKMIDEVNSEPEFRKHYFSIARPLLETLVGNELAMQKRVNLSIQMPRDDSSLLPVHADTWSGDSPYEVVVWVPLVDCYLTKSMYLLPPISSKKLEEDFRTLAGSTSEDLFESIKEEIVWLEVPYGSQLIFNQGLPHGNRVNLEDDTRWSLNCRFKGIFTPYGDKKIGEFFEPVTLRAASRNGISYRLPQS